MLIIPSMDMQNPTFHHPRSPSAISTSVSDSIRAPSPTAGPTRPFLDSYYSPNDGWRGERTHGGVDATTIVGTGGIPSSPSGASRINTRQTTMSKAVEGTYRRPSQERIRHGLLMLPRLTRDPIACNKPCYVVHPDFPDKVVAEGKTGGSWKSKTQRFSHLCSQGEQMVQVHTVTNPKYKLMHIEDKQLFTVLGDALVKKSGSSVFMKWDSRYLIRKTT